MNIKEEHLNIANDKNVEAIITYLKRLDVLYEIPQNANLFDIKETNIEYIFSQPGMRYCQATEIVRALLNSPEFNKFSILEKESLLKKLNDDICGRMLEDIEQKVGCSIINKVVLYTGESIKNNIDIIYLNVEEFLINLKHMCFKLSTPSIKDSNTKIELFN